MILVILSLFLKREKAVASKAGEALGKEVELELFPY
jgi:hypothetical protein